MRNYVLILGLYLVSNHYSRVLKIELRKIQGNTILLSISPFYNKLTNLYSDIVTLREFSFSSSGMVNKIKSIPC